MKNLKNFVKKIHLLFPFLKVIQDQRYLYHYLQGFLTGKTLRSMFSKLEARLFFRSEDETLNFALHDIDGLEELTKNGYIENPLIIDNAKIDEINEFLITKPMHDPESADNSYFLFEDKLPNVKRGFYKCEDVVHCPHILSIANNPSLLNVAYNYFGAVPTIDYIGSWWSFPSDELALTQSFHRDIDTLNSLKFFVYLSDVDAKSGPHIYVKGSHDSKFKTSKDKMHADNEIINEYGSNNIIELKGQKGYTFIADTFGFHKGLPPTENNRLVLQIIYTLKRTPFSPKKPFISNDDAIKLCSNPYSKYVNRNIIKI